MGLRERGILALDNMSVPDAFRLATKFHGKVWGSKGNDLFDGDHSPNEVVSCLKRHGRVFVDIKGHDIPATIANRVKRHAQNGADLITVHASGGSAMLEAAVEAYEKHRPKDGLGILAVTVLTSMTEEECYALYGCGAKNAVLSFAKLAARAGVYGIVCSAKELPVLKRQRFMENIHTVVPGTRSMGKDLHDQARVMTPGEAIRLGADLLVIGRQLTTAEDPDAEAEALDKEITEAERTVS